MTAIELLPPDMRWLPGAAAFAERLAAACPEALEQCDGLGWYAWEAAIPPEGQWEEAARGFARHVRDMIGTQG